jgi:hypothetical protein
MDCLATFFVDEFSNFLLFPVVLLVLSRPEPLSSSTEIPPCLKREFHPEISLGQEFKPLP